MTITEFLAARFAEEWAAARDRELAAGLDTSRGTREADAKRRILALYDEANAHRSENAEAEAGAWLMDRIAGDLAAVYLDHPDYGEVAS